MVFTQQIKLFDEEYYYTVSVYEHFVEVALKIVTETLSYQ